MGSSCSSNLTAADAHSRSRTRHADVDRDARNRHDMRTESMLRDSLMFTSLASVSGSPLPRPADDRVDPFASRAGQAPISTPSARASGSISGGLLPTAAASVAVLALAPWLLPEVADHQLPPITTAGTSFLNPLAVSPPSIGVDDSDAAVPSRTPVSNASFTAPTRRGVTAGLHRMPRSGTESTDGDNPHQQLNALAIGQTALTPASTFLAVPGQPLAVSDPMAVALVHPDSVGFSDGRRSLASAASNAQVLCPRRMSSLVPVGGYIRRRSRRTSGLRARVSDGVAVAVEDDTRTAHEGSATLDVLSGMDLVTSTSDMANTMVVDWLRHIGTPPSDPQ